MKLYSMDVLICATAYIKAESEEDARNMIANLAMDGMDLNENSPPEFDLAICGRDYPDMSDDDVAEVTLSPSMTFHGPLTVATIERLSIDNSDGLEEAYDFEEVEDDGA